MSRPDITAYVHGNARDFHASMQRVRGDASRTARHTQSQFTTMAGRLRGAVSTVGINAFNPLIASATAALAPIALVRQSLATIADASQIGKVADKVALTTDELQQMRHVAELSGVAVSQTDTAMQRFARRVAEAANGSGELLKVLQANGVELRNADGTMRSQRDILRDYADLIKNAASEQDRLLLAFKAFDTEGAALVNLFKDGASAIDTMARKTDEAGGVIDEKLIRKAEELDDRLSQLWRTFEINSKSAILTAIDELDRLVTKVNEIGNAGIFKGLAKYLPTFGGAELTYLDPDLARAKGQTLGPDARIRDAFAGEIEQADDALVEALRQRYGAATSKAADTVRPTIIPASGGGGGGGGSRNRSAKEAIDIGQRMIEQLEHERELLRLTGAEREKAIALRRAGAEATKEQKEEIGRLVEEIYNEKQAMEAAEEAARFFGDTLEGAITSALPTIETGNEALDGLLNTMIKVAAQALLLGKGPLAGLFGGGLFGGGGGGLLGMLFGGARAGGGDVSPGRLYRVNEYGDEYFAPSTHGKVLPAGSGDSAGNGIQEIVVRGVFVDDNGVIKARIDQTSALTTQAGISQYDKALPGRFSEIIERNG